MTDYDLNYVPFGGEFCLKFQTLDFYFLNLFSHLFFNFLEDEYNNMTLFEFQTFCEPNVPLEPITTLSWDPLEEALWTGTSAVLITYNNTISLLHFSQIYEVLYFWLWIQNCQC